MADFALTPVTKETAEERLKAETLEARAKAAATGSALYLYHLYLYHHLYLWRSSRSEHACWHVFQRSFGAYQTVIIGIL